MRPETNETKEGRKEDAWLTMLKLNMTPTLTFVTLLVVVVSQIHDFSLPRGLLGEESQKN